MRRPTGVTIVTVLAIISGLIGLSWCPLLVLLFSGAVTIASGGLLSVIGVLGLIIATFMMGGSILQFIFAYGAFRLHSWAWWLGIIGTALPLVGALLSIFDEGTSTGAALGAAVLPLGVFIYLWTPAARQAFRV